MGGLVVGALLVILMVLPNQIFPQEFASYYSRNAFLAGTSSSYLNGLYGFANPANSAMPEKFNARFYWATEGDDELAINDWGFFSTLPNLGFGILRQRLNGSRITDYSISLAGGGDLGAAGISYRWSKGDKSAFARQNLFSLGVILRPLRQLSVGMVGSLSSETSAREGVLELGLRPLGNNRFTLFGDLAIQKTQKLSEAPWSAGAALTILPGLSLTGRYFDSEAFTVGLNFSFGFFGVGGQSHFNSDQKQSFNSYSMGVGDYRANIFAKYLSKNAKYIALNLQGRVDYQKYYLFDNGTLRYMDLLQTLRQANRDPQVAVIALNLSALRILPEHAWEMREVLRETRDAGKKVIIFIDHATMTSYHLASVADIIMLDPQGSIMIPGYLSGRTFLKGTLEKMGLGFDEWRFFKYKSAAEMLSREEMSPADREQRRDFIEDMYNIVKKDVTASRQISAERFDQLIDEQVYFRPEDALKEGLVDTLCRWSQLKTVIKSLAGKKKRKLSPGILKERATLNEDWGTPSQVAVVYAQGICAMDQGIRARHLEKVLLKLADKKSVKAVVLRVDSPGGDGMASDYVAEALKKCAGKKPVIVSQGQVAASGGYWISMYGDSIIAGPGTITGSIGVIAGWIYDKGFSEKLGLTADYVKKGAYADWGFGVRLPLLGIQIPARNLTGEERARVEQIIGSMYDDFVEKVAEGRGMASEEVYRIAEGRIYSGIDGQRVGLVDEIGGLLDALELARKMAGIPENRFYEIVEIPKYKGLFNIERFKPVTIRQQAEDDPAIQVIKMISEKPGYPYPLLLPGDYPVIE